jgi:hypothetical protein
MDTNEVIGHQYVVITADQQLYIVVINIMWDSPDQYGRFCLRLGGMHLLMSYVGCIGTLMTGSGTEEVLSSTFGGVPKVLSGKKFHGNVHALRILVDGLLRSVFTQLKLNKVKPCTASMARERRTSKLWIICLFRPIFLINGYIREGG